MIPEPEQPQDDLETVLAGLPVPPASPQHRAELRRRVLETFDRAAPGPALPSWRGALQKGADLMRHPISRLVLATAATVLLAAWLFAPTPTFALTDLITPIVEAKTAKFRMTVKMELQPKVMTATGYYRAPNQFRQEFAEMVNITDFDRGRMTSLLPATKQAFVIDLKGRHDPDRPVENYFGNLRSNLARYKQSQEGEVQELGEKLVDGRKLFGFRLSTPGQLTTIWGDVETGRPVRIEAETAGPVKTEAVFSDIEFDLPLEASLFDTEPPAGYKRIQAHFNVARPEEKDFIASLTGLTGLTGGEFPAGFDAASLASAFVKMALKDRAKPDEGEQAMTKLMTESVEIGRGLTFATQPPRDAEAHYAGRNVKRDGPKVAVFWYKPAGGSRYRVVWSDLSVTEAEAAPQVEGASRIYPELPKK
jgi:outer membrane lipoprotein-sorting protein